MDCHAYFSLLSRSLWESKTFYRTMFYGVLRQNILPKKGTFSVLASSQNFLSCLVSQITQQSICARCKQDVQRLHAHILVNGLRSHRALCTKLMELYALFGGLLHGRLIFDTICRQESHAFVWNVMIRGYILNNETEQAFNLYRQMSVSSVKLDGFTLTALLKGCASLLDCEMGRRVHGHVVVCGYGLDLFVVTALMDAYMKCCNFVDAYKLFDGSVEKDLTMWNSMISGLMLDGDPLSSMQVFRRMRMLDELRGDSITATSVLSSCGKIGDQNLAREVHAWVLRCGFSYDLVVLNSLMDMYFKCSHFNLATRVFAAMSRRDCASWNVIISGLAQNDRTVEALNLFSEMLSTGFKPTACTLLTVLPVCASLGAHKAGKEIHGYIAKNMLYSDVRLDTALLDMYAKCGFLSESCKIFRSCTRKDLVLWNAMLTGFLMNSRWHEVLQLFRQLQVERMMPDHVTLHCVLVSLESLNLVKYTGVIYCYIIRNGFEKESLLTSSLISTFMQERRIKQAHHLLRIHSVKDAVPWNSLSGGLLKIGFSEDTWNLFKQMLWENVKPNSVTMLVLLGACANLSSLKKGMSVHGFIIKSGFHTNAFVCTSLIKLYTSCGCLVAATCVFNKLGKKDMVSWSAAIAAHGIHGFGTTALQLFNNMNSLNMGVDHVAFVEVLSACAHSGLVEEGWKCFESMVRDHSLVPRLEHYGCMVDLLCRAGLLNKANEFIGKMPMVPDAGIWGSLFNACAVNGNAEMGEQVFKQLTKLEAIEAQHYVMMSNIYASARMWEKVSEVRILMEKRNLTKEPGCCWIEPVICNSQW